MAFGDHLISKRFLYTHHGIDLGNGKVIHYSGLASKLKKGKIEVTSLSDFGNANGSKVVNRTSRRFATKETVVRAYARIGEDKYNVITNNCEHFVEWCINGKHSSRQIVRHTRTVASVSKIPTSLSALIRTTPFTVAALSLKYSLDHLPEIVKFLEERKFSKITKTNVTPTKRRQAKYMTEKQISELKHIPKHRLKP